MKGSITFLIKLFSIFVTLLLLNSGNVNEVILFEDNVESYDTYSTEFSNWQNLDLDEIRSWGIKNLNYPGEFDKSGFIIMANTDDNVFSAHSGNKFFACISADIENYGGTGNNDWLISKEVSIDRSCELVFYARAFNHNYGKEKFNVAVKNALNGIDDFNIISGSESLTSNEQWTRYNFDLSSYQGENINFAINCVSKNAYMFWVDDIQIIAKSESGDDNLLPDNYQLRQNYPNPFNPSTIIEFSIPEKNHVNVEVYNLVGELVSNLTDKIYNAGTYQVNFNASNLSSGVYIYKMTSGKYTESKKLTLLK